MLKPISIFTVLFLLTACAGNDTTSNNNGQNGTETMQNVGSKLSMVDRQFVHDATIGGMTEVQAGQIAVNRASNGDLRQFGQQMADDHQRVNNQLTELAQQKGIGLPTGLDMDSQNIISKLNSLHDKDFDENYITGQVNAHTETIKLFENEANSGQDADLRAFASATLPTLQHHLHMIKNLQTSIGTTDSRELEKRGPQLPNGPIVPPDQPAGNNQPPPERQPNQVPQQ
jgi:putative membrane protein